MADFRFKAIQESLSTWVRLRSPYNRAAVCPALGSPIYGSDGNLASHSYNPPPPPPNDAPDFSPRATTQYCRIPGCGNKAYYDFAEQEQTEYCGQGHEL
jgi:hypothetical protein